MMKKILIVIILIHLLINCNKKETGIKEVEITKNNCTFHLIKEKEINLNLFYPEFVRIQNLGHIHLRSFPQSYICRVTRFDKNLNKIKDFEIHKGQGPGRWLDLPNILGNERSIIIIDRMGKRINFFDYNFNYLNCFKHDFKYWFVNNIWACFSKNNTYLVILNEDTLSDYKGYNRAIQYILSVGNLSKTKLLNRSIYTSWLGTKKNEQSTNLSGSNTSFIIVNNFIYLLDSKNYLLTKMDLSGQTIGKIKVLFQKKTFTKEKREKWIGKGGSYSRGGSFAVRFHFPEELWPATGIIQIGDGIAILRRTDYNIQKTLDKIESDYFDLDLKYQGKLYLPFYPEFNHPGYEAEGKANRFFYWFNKKLFFIDKAHDEDIFLSTWKMSNG